MVLECMTSQDVSHHLPSLLSIGIVRLPPTEWWVIIITHCTVIFLLQHLPPTCCDFIYLVHPCSKQIHIMRLKKGFGNGAMDLTFTKETRRKEVRQTSASMTSTYRLFAFWSLFGRFMVTFAWVKYHTENVLVDGPCCKDSWTYTRSCRCYSYSLCLCIWSTDLSSVGSCLCHFAFSRRVPTPRPRRGTVCYWLDKTVTWEDDGVFQGLFVCSRLRFIFGFVQLVRSQLPL